MTTSEAWKLPNRIRMLEEFDDAVPREVIFDLNLEKQQFFRTHWLRGLDIEDVRRDWNRRETVAEVTETESD